MYEDAHQLAKAVESDGSRAMPSLDDQIERLQRNLDILRERLAPVRTRYEREQKELSIPREEPRSDLHDRVESLFRINLGFEGLIEDIVL